MKIEKDKGNQEEAIMKNKDQYIGEDIYNEVFIENV